MAVPYAARRLLVSLLGTLLMIPGILLPSVGAFGLVKLFGRDRGSALLPQDELLMFLSYVVFGLVCLAGAVVCLRYVWKGGRRGSAPACKSP